jgi:phosphate transport system substrate-binding protein
MNGSVGRYIVFVIAAAGCLIATACSDNGENEPLTGEVNVDGSLTVYSLSTSMAEAFATEEPGIRVNVVFSSTGRGFELLCEGAIEIAGASRPINQQEIDACASRRIEDLVEAQVGVDALTVVVNPQVSFVECLTTRQAFDIFTGRVTAWDDVDPAFPDRPITVYHPDADSGSFDFFVDAVIEYFDENAVHTAEGQNPEGDAGLASAIAGDENSIGYFGFSRYEEAGETLRALEIDSGEGCVAPSLDAAWDRSYYLSRPLFIYSREAYLEDTDSPVLAFLNFFVENTTGSRSLRYIYQLPLSR